MRLKFTPAAALLGACTEAVEAPLDRGETRVIEQRVRPGLRPERPAEVGPLEDGRAELRAETLQVARRVAEDREVHTAADVHADGRGHYDTVRAAGRLQKARGCYACSVTDGKVRQGQAPRSLQPVMLMR